MKVWCIIALVTCLASAEDETKVAKVIGGDEARPHEFPYQVSLKKFFPVLQAFQHNCGGSLISPEWILTAAHCVDATVPLFDHRVLLGAHNQTDPNEPHQVALQPVQIILHDQWVENGNENDIALVKIDPPSDLLQPGIIEIISLPAEGELPPDGTQVTLSGWGRTTNTNFDSSPVLLKLNRTVMPFDVCVKALDHVQEVRDGFICTSSMDEKGACNGDSGGPMTWDDNGVKKVVGVASNVLHLNAKPSCTGGLQFYTDVSHYLEWIRAKSQQV